MQNRNLVVSLDMNVFDDTFIDEMLRLDESQQINLIAERINNICELLLKKEPTAKWFIAWREYGIFSKDSRTISNTVKNKMKQQFSEICWKYPNLTIIAGTVSTGKITSLIKSQDLLQYYSVHKWLNKDENFLKHMLPIQEIVKQLEEKKVDKDKKIEIIRNTCYIFSSSPIYLKNTLPHKDEMLKYPDCYIFTKDPLNLYYVSKNNVVSTLEVKDYNSLKEIINKTKILKKESEMPLHSILDIEQLKKFTQIIYQNKNKHPHIQRIDKTTPFYELDDVDTQKLSEYGKYFKIGGKKLRNMEHYFDNFIVEICMEHVRGVAKREVAELKLPEPLMQFILSATTHARTENFTAKYVLHLDASYRPILYTSNPDHDSKEIQFFKHDIFNSDDRQNLEPIETLFPFRCYLLDQLKKVIALTSDPTLSGKLFTYKTTIEESRFSQALLTDDENTAYNYFKTLLMTMRSDFKKLIINTEDIITTFENVLEETIKKEKRLKLCTQHVKEQETTLLESDIPSKPQL